MRVLDLESKLLVRASDTCGHLSGRYEVRVVALQVWNEELPWRALKVLSRELSG